MHKMPPRGSACPARLPSIGYSAQRTVQKLGIFRKREHEMGSPSVRSGGDFGHSGVLIRIEVHCAKRNALPLGGLSYQRDDPVRMFASGFLLPFHSIQAVSTLHSHSTTESQPP